MRFKSFTEMLSFYENQGGNSVALIYEENGEKKTMSYAELHSAVREKARELKSTGKTCLGVFCESSPECIITVFAAAETGLQLVMLDPNTSSEFIIKQIEASDTDFLWSSENELVEEFEPYLTEGVTDGGGILFFTSGTTSMSKAVVLTQESLCASAYNGSEMLPLEQSDILMCLLPLAHVFGFICSLLWGLSCGAAVALGRGPRYITEDCRYFRPTAVSLVPMLLAFFLKGQLFNDELKLILIGAGDCPDSLIDGARALGKRVCFGYGLTETSSGVAISVSGDPHAMDICPDNKITIARDGEIVIKAPTCIMKGYYKDKKSTDEVLRDGFLYTGDLGYRDENGRLHITGRKKEMLVLPSGTKIFLPEYEAKLAAALGNRELAVILIDSKPVLVIHETRRKKEEVTELLGNAMKNFSRTEQIKDIIFTDRPLPRTATGKVKRWEIQKTEEEKI